MAKTTINQNQTGLLIKDGSIVRTLGAGTYKTRRYRNELIVFYPNYAQSYMQTASVRTKESAVASVTATLGVAVVDAQAMHLSGRSAHDIVGKLFNRQMVAAAAAMELTELIASGLTVDEAAMNAELAEYGLKASVEIAPRIVLPRNLQNAIDAQEVARQRARAELEEARGRTAVIRHYANVGKMTRDNPDLLRLLLGQKAKSINVAFDALERTKR